MAGGDDPRAKAAARADDAVEPNRRLPDRVFRGEWAAYWFFDPDFLHDAEFPAYLQRILADEGGSCACFVNLTLKEEGRPETEWRRYLSLGEPGSGLSGVPWWSLDDSVLSSDTGRWCIYSEGKAEFAILALWDRTLLARFQVGPLRPARHFLGAEEIEQTLHPGPREILRSWETALVRNYGAGTTVYRTSDEPRTSSPVAPGDTPAGRTPGPTPLASLVPRTADHARALYPLLKGTTVCDTLVWDGPESLENFVATYAAPPGTETHRNLTILGGGEPVGSLSIRPGFQPQRGDIGYWVGIRFQGRGYATAAVRASLEIAFGEMGMEKVEACAFLGNFASRRVLEKCGFQQEGLTRKAVLKRGRWLDEWVFGITREDWRTRTLAERTP